MAVVSDDHADESTCAAHAAAPCSGPQPRPISREAVKRHSKEPFWAVIDGFVVDATAFVDTHPGGLKKLLSTDAAAVGATGEEFGFSLSRGRNAHFPGTGKCFRSGIERYLRGGAGSDDHRFLAPCTVEFPEFGKVVVLGRLVQGGGT